MNSQQLLNKKVQRHLPISGKQTGTIKKVDATCYHPNHSEDNPWIEIKWDHNNHSYTWGCINTLLNIGIELYT